MFSKILNLGVAKECVVHDNNLYMHDSELIYFMVILYLFELKTANFLYFTKQEKQRQVKCKSFCKHCGKGETMLVASIFYFSLNVIYSIKAKQNVIMLSVNALTLDESTTCSLLSGKE